MKIRRKVQRTLSSSALAIGVALAVIVQACSPVPRGDRRSLMGRSDWLGDRTQAMLQRAGPFDVLLGEWVALLLAALVSVLAALLIRRVTTGILRRTVARTSIVHADLVVTRTRAPVLLFWTVLVFSLAIVPLGLGAPALARTGILVRAGFIAALFWSMTRVIGALQDSVPTTAWAVRHPAGRSIVPLLARVTRVAVGIVGVIAVIGAFGFPITTLIAGLGIGGIALALGAQQSLENFFGSVSLALDQPMRPGDYIAVGEVQGNVESLGIRSTRIRTLERSIITIPNGELSNQRIENFASRDRIMLNSIFGVSYGTTAAQLREIQAGFARVLQARTELWRENVIVRFVALGASSLDIEVMCWFAVTSYDEFRVIREEVLFGFMEVVERAGSSFAFPTQTVQLEGGSSPVRIATEPLGREQAPPGTP